MPITTLIFDLDSALYPFDNGYEDHVRSRILLFMSEKLGVPAEKAEAEWKRLYAQAGQTLAALRLGGYSFDKDDYWDFIREGYSQFLKPDPELRKLLDSLPQAKWVLTNCQEKHALMCIETIGLEGCFKEVLGSDSFNGKCKPAEDVYKLCLSRAAVTAAECVFFDDTLKNVVAAKKLGMKGVLVVSESHEKALQDNLEVLQQVDAVISPVPTVSNLRRVLPELFEGTSVS